jgi:hypothetical protein
MYFFVYCKRFYLFLIGIFLYKLSTNDRPRFHLAAIDCSFLGVAFFDRFADSFIVYFLQDNEVKRKENKGSR